VTEGAHLEAVKQLERLVTDVTRTVSDDVRSALTGIQGMAELIRDGELRTDEIQECCDNIFKEARRVNRLVADLTALNRVEATNIQIRRGPVDLDRTLAEVVRRVQAANSTARIGFTPTLPQTYVACDRDRLAQVVENLLADSLRRSRRQDRIEMVTCRRYDAAVVSIADQTRGVRDDYDDLMHGRYERYENDPSRMIGAGFGVAVAVRVIELMGGHVWVDTTSDGWFTRRFTIPVWKY
jgi:signal transduction histidine kinase